MGLKGIFALGVLAAVFAVSSPVFAQQKAEVTLHVPGRDLHCECEDADLYAAIDLLADKLDRQVLRYKDKMSTEKRTSEKRV